MMVQPLLAALVAVQVSLGPDIDVSSVQDQGPSMTAERVATTARALRVVDLHDGMAGQLEVSAPTRIDGGIRIDGRLDDAAWIDAPVLTGFTQFDPVEGVAASQNTEVRVLVTDDAILFGIRAEDSDAASIRSTLARRDGFGGSDDWVRIILDTFNDQRRAFVFQVNPRGIQADGLWLEGRGGWRGPVDWNPDFLWKSAGQQDDGGYSVEVEVPFKSLRFPEVDSQDWGLQVTRRIQRSGYTESWAPMTSNEANRLAQSGSLRGLEDLDPGLFMEINPVLTGSRQGSWDDARQGLVRDPANGDFGLNVTYGLTSNLTLDGTYNPDFSQVEADAGQITVNERFALYLPEKRPFFLEGTDVFSMPERLVYTRSINNPVGAAKLSGKMGGTSVAYIGAMDDVATGDNPVVNLVRLRRDVGESSTLGAVYTDRTTPGTGFNRVLGADGRFVLARRYTVNVMGAASADGASDAGTRWGSLFSAEVRRSGRSFTARAGFKDIDRDFRAGSGFIRQVGITEADVRTEYTWRAGQGALLESVELSLDAEATWERDAFWARRGPEEWDTGAGLSFSFRGNVSGSVSYGRRGYDFASSRYDGFFVDAGPGLRPFAPDQSLFQGLESFRVRSRISTFERVRGSFGLSLSETPLFDRGVPVDVANSVRADVGLTLYPTGSLSMELGARHVRLSRVQDGARYSTATIPRLQGRYQFSRALFIRAIGEYRSQERGDALDPASGAGLLYCDDGACTRRAGSDTNDFRIEALLGYEPSPGTVIFVGYTRAMEDTLPFRFQDVQSESDGLFVKLSYRFRM